MVTLTAVALTDLLPLLQKSREQTAIGEFSQALLVIPKTLSVNAAQDSTELVAQLRAFHNASQTDQSKADLKWCVCVCACVRACVRVCVRACVRVCTVS